MTRPIKEATEAPPLTPGQSASLSSATAKPGNRSLPAEAVGLEIPVRVRGTHVAAVVLGVTEHTEAFEEETSTMIVFPRGAVVRLAARVKTGQSVLIANRKTNQSVLCRVVNVRAGTGESRYAEVEFTQPAMGFWGVTFPSEASSVLSRHAQNQDGPSVEKESLSDATSPVVSSPHLGIVPPRASESAVLLPARTEPAAIFEPAANADKSSKVLAREQSALNISPARPTDAFPLSAGLPVEKNPSRAAEIGRTVRRGKTSGSASEIISSSPISAAKVETPLTAEKTLKYEPVRLDMEESPVAEPALPLGIGAPRGKRGKDFAPFREPAESATSFEALAREAGQARRASEKASSRRKMVFSAASAAVMVMAAGAWFFLHKPAGLSAASASASAAAKPTTSSGIAAPLHDAGTVGTQAPSVASPAVPLAATATPTTVAASTGAKNLPKEVAGSQSAPAPSFTGSTNARPVSSARVSSLPVQPPPDVAGATPAGLPANPANGLLGSIIPGETRTNVALPPPPAPKMRQGGVVLPPRLLSSAAPSYPVLAKENRVEGIVKIQASIDSQGNVKQMKVLAGPPLLRQAAMEALRHWKFAPSTLDGQPVASQTILTIKFTLN